MLELDRSESERQVYERWREEQIRKRNERMSEKAFDFGFRSSKTTSSSRWDRERQRPGGDPDVRGWGWDYDELRQFKMRRHWRDDKWRLSRLQLWMCFGTPTLLVLLTLIMDGTDQNLNSSDFDALDRYYVVKEEKGQRKN